MKILVVNDDSIHAPGIVLLAKAAMELGEVTVVWGGKEQPERKVALLRALLRTTPASIDVSVPDSPTTT